MSTLAVAVGEEPATVEEVCEPFLVRAGMIARTPRGRVATAAAWQHLGLTPRRAPRTRPSRSGPATTPPGPCSTSSDRAVPGGIGPGARAWNRGPYGSRHTRGEVGPLPAWMNAARIT